jgi:LAO/AO transport system kinase
MGLVDEILSGKRLSLARLLTQIENETTAGREALSELYPYTGHAYVIGITGAPGTGKSSLVNSLAYAFRHPDDGKPAPRVGIIAVDPSSPFSGGAILGDRVRMKDLAGDTGVFIRSMATRGSLGGLAATTAGMVEVLDAAGFEIILVETVGAGQSEIDIARLAHTTLVVEAPGLGDDIQAIKAGILEIADILVINKADLPGIEITERALKASLDLAHPTLHLFRIDKTSAAILLEGMQISAPTPTDLWIPPIVKTIATQKTGVAELKQSILEHRRYIEQNGLKHFQEVFRTAYETGVLLEEALLSNWRQDIPGIELQETLHKVYAREISPWEAVQRFMHARTARS